MSTLSLRLPDHLHKRAKELAEQEGISINQMVSTALAEKISALDTESFLAVRASYGNQKRYREILSKVPDVPPEAGDEI
ncbi:toxin-antitoxin system HicB family antitoxin [Nibricoccus sp. IMCC34717]|uniref:toxin-antitoxin system HicB family antitoxin n=1 Tax=Nibricoccus sp. IMCC34717 TaxID=3034021 RepID=UPI003850C625